MSEQLTVAQHTTDNAYWEGGNYELNLSFEALRDKEWLQVLKAVWAHPALFGPLEKRHWPGQPISAQVMIQVPPPTATVSQHGLFRIGEMTVGCDVQATRSLFECVSVLIPMGMFSGIRLGQDTQQRTPEALQVLDDLFYDIALQIYDIVPFKIAAIGYERACQLPSELRTDGEVRHNFLVSGNFMAQNEVMMEIEPDLTPYKQVRQDLVWMPPRR